MVGTETSRAAGPTQLSAQLPLTNQDRQEPVVEDTKAGP
jgi:hypothetical protein